MYCLRDAAQSTPPHVPFVALRIFASEKRFLKKICAVLVVERWFVHCRKICENRISNIPSLDRTLVVPNTLASGGRRAAGGGISGVCTRNVHARQVASSCPDRWYGGRTKIRRSIHVTITLTSQVGYPYRCTGAPMPFRFRHAMLRGTHEFSRDTIRKCTTATIVYRLYTSMFLFLRSRLTR